ncbi:tetratricopeptide repeat protein [Paludibacter propionicigenes]|uniref:tetratricopeptide repeat protein n=1 Tax=Paludibacter propionicigenes TaxID=185300 RepID=UPI0002F705D3|nr:tetratricopeptide repeat protein [Paludibacter propionicigenes]
MGIFERKNKDLQKAFLLAEKSISIDPYNSFGYLQRGGAYFQEDQFEKAFEDASKAIELNSNNAYAYNLRARVFVKRGENEKAEVEFKKAIDLDPNYVNAYNARGVFFTDLKQCEKAIEDFDKAVELKPNSAYIYNNRGIAWTKLDEDEKAMVDYNRTLELDSNYVFTYNNRGNLWLKLGEIDKALKDYNKAIELDSNFANAYRNRGILYFKIGNYDNAIENFQKAISLDEGFKFLEDKIKLAQEKINEQRQFNESNVEEEDKVEKSKLENEIENIIESIRDAAKSKVKMVAHYTKLSVADIYVKEINVKMHYSNAIYMNDPMEGKVFFDYLDNEEITKAYVSGEKRTETSVYLGSFLPAEENEGEVSHEDELVMWRTYGKDENGKEASGCNVVISSDFFKLNSSLEEKSISMSDNEEELLNVVYIKKLKSSKEITNDNKDKIEPAIAQLKDKLLELIQLRNKYQKKDDFYREIENSIFKRLSTISYLFKSADYNYEHEVRVITYIPRNSDNIKFREVNESNLPRKQFYIESYNDILPYIKKIYLGPKVEHYQRWSLYLDYEIRQRVKEGMTNVNPSNIEIIKSECKFQ